MAELTFDVVEQILIQLDVKDLIRCKSVCKAWYSFMSSSRFVKVHLKHTYNNDRNNHELAHRRICLPCIDSVDGTLLCNYTYIVGSCNGLVCVSSTEVEFMVINPLTRQQKKLQAPPYRPHLTKMAREIRELVCWGFGYDSSTDDYKVISGYRKTYSKKQTLFYVLTLKSNTWKVIGQVNYRPIDGADGILCGGALYWFMSDKKNKVIISFDLSTEEFKEIPQPTHQEYKCEVEDEHILGVLEECLCIYWHDSRLSTNKWIMRNKKWELYNDHCEGKYDVAHTVKTTGSGVYIV